MIRTATRGGRTMQQGQVFQLKRTGRDGDSQWAYRYRAGGRDSQRMQRGGFASERDATDALERALDRVRREQRIPRSLTFAELVEVYLAQHDVQPVTTEKLRWLLSKATAVFGERRIGELTSQEIAEWRMNLSPGYRFEATQAAPADAQPRRRLGHARHQPRQGRSRQPDAASERTAPIRELGRTRSCGCCARRALWADDPVRGRDWASAGRVGRTRVARHRPRRARRVRATLVHPARAEAAEDRGQPQGGAASRPSDRRARPAKPRATRSWCSRASEAAISTSTTSALTNGGQHRKLQVSRRLRRVYDLRHTLRPLLSVPASRPSICPDTWAPA